MNSSNPFFRAVHFLYGLLSGLALSKSLVFGFTNIVFFHVYEFVEFFIIRDRVYHDLREFYAGFALASLIPLLSPL